MIRDMMPAFDLFQPQTADEAVALLGKYGADGWALAGGTDSLDWFKDRVPHKRPKAVVDLSGISELRGIREVAGGVEIGALTRLAEVAEHRLIRERYGVLAQAARRVGAPQIRNQGTLGGNLAQDSRCWYYRNAFSCYRAGGNTCFADTPTGMDREHCLFGANRCVTVNSSDTAPALIVLEAEVVIRNGRGERVVPVEEFFVGPAVDIRRMNVLKPGDLLTTIRIPDRWAGAKFYFEKVSDRNSWDFPLVNVAAALVVRGGKIERARVAVNGVAPTPLRLKAVEEAVVGSAPDEETAEVAGQTAVWGAKPLKFNGYKVALLRNLVKRAIRAAGA